ncbi:hypothetical protein [Rhodococcus tibetensis]|uniref:DUF3263 domain-containing protein n=1 Tax=Rhodococcus tibetensis TaxID=2965064 RepID=A0ABT1Q946_9NOCA|nr:hypothetical protein [Rhodococcus sp. FXJ9.536]MCQ4118769.1 hypothetical protein [Rhodococcus sp. FXJ9.536]
MYLIEFARRWAAFGGPSDEDILVQFGIDRAEFTHLLARTIDEFFWEAETVRQIVSVYQVHVPSAADRPHVTR